MIDYANELVEEIKANNPSNATPITVSGVPIKDVRYTGVGLEISCDDLDFVDKDSYDDLERDRDWLRDENEELEDKVEELEDKLHKYERALDKINDIVFPKADTSEVCDEILDIINEVTE